VPEFFAFLYETHWVFNSFPDWNKMAGKTHFIGDSSAGSGMGVVQIH
jgi:hypothetical protein